MSGWVMVLHLGQVDWLPYERWAAVAEPWARRRERGTGKLLGALVGAAVALGGGMR